MYPSTVFSFPGRRGSHAHKTAGRRSAFTPSCVPSSPYGFHTTVSAHPSVLDTTKILEFPASSMEMSPDTPLNTWSVSSEMLILLKQKQKSKIDGTESSTGARRVVTEEEVCSQGRAFQQVAQQSSDVLIQQRCLARGALSRFMMLRRGFRCPNTGG